MTDSEIRQLAEKAAAEYRAKPMTPEEVDQWAKDLVDSVFAGGLATD